MFNLQIKSNLHILKRFLDEFDLFLFKQKVHVISMPWCWQSVLVGWNLCDWFKSRHERRNRRTVENVLKSVVVDAVFVRRQIYNQHYNGSILLIKTISHGAPYTCTVRVGQILTRTVRSLHRLNIPQPSMLKYSMMDWYVTRYIYPANGS